MDIWRGREGRVPKMFNFLEKLGALLLYSFEVAFLVCCSLFMYNGLWVIFCQAFLISVSSISLSLFFFERSRMTSY